jgi:hypothetical protein
MPAPVPGDAAFPDSRPGPVLIHPVSSVQDAAEMVRQHRNDPFRHHREFF